MVKYIHIDGQIYSYRWLMAINNVRIWVTRSCTLLKTKRDIHV